MFSRPAADRKRAAAALPMPPRKKMRAIIGDIQSGKTAAIIEEIKNSIPLCIVIVRNVTPDVRQFMNACRRANVPAISLSSDAGVIQLNANPLQPPRVVVLLANAVNIKKARALFKEVGSPPFTLIIDEADRLAFSKEPSDKSFRAELERLQDMAADEVLVTATMFNFMTLPEVGGRLTAKDIQVLQPAANYCGIRQVYFGKGTLDDPIENEMDASFIPPNEVGCDNPSQTRAPESLVRWMTDLASRDHPELQALNHPVLALARMGNRLNTIFEIAKTARKVNGRILPVVYTGDGVSVPTAFLEVLSDRGVDLVATRYKRLRDFSVLQLPLQQFLSVVKDTGVLGRRPVIVIAAGLLAARGVNFTDASYEWALTHEYFLPSSSTNITELQQGLRLLGNKPWSLEAFTPVLTTKHSIMKDIEVGYLVQAETIHNVKESEDMSLRAATTAVQLDTKPSVRYANNMVINSVKVSK